MKSATNHLLSLIDNTYCLSQQHPEMLQWTVGL